MMMGLKFGRVKYACMPLLVFLFFGIGALPSRADVISQTTNLAAQTTDWSESVDFTFFDPTLGTLTSVTITEA